MHINRSNSPLFKQGLAKWSVFVQAYKGPYDLTKSVYAGMNKKVTFVCPKHNEVTMDAKVLMRGAVCRYCALEARKGARRFSAKQMLAKFKAVHGDKYDYSKAVYTGQSNPVTIICPEHGEFQQKPEFHWSGSGCSKCFNAYRRGAKQRYTMEEFKERLQHKFEGNFEVVSPRYVNTKTTLEVLCKAHNAIVQAKPEYLLNSYNPCPQCNHMKSKGEEEVAAYLNKLTAIRTRDRTIIAPKELDIVATDHKLAIEYCGAYYHSHGNVEDERKNKHKHYTKYQMAQNAGYRLITIFDYEWEERKPVMKRMLRNMLGKTRGRIMARKCVVKNTTYAEAKTFYDNYHPQGGAGSGEHYGLYWKDKLVACMRFTFGANDRGEHSKREWTLTRYATRLNVVGGASRLFKAFIQDKQPSTVKSFSDNRFFTGGMYEKLGFRLAKEALPDYIVWSMRLGARPKSHYQRRHLQKRLQEHGLDEEYDCDTDLRTEAEMTYYMGARRLYDCGKKKWVWERKS